MALIIPGDMDGDTDTAITGDTMVGDTTMDMDITMATGMVIQMDIMMRVGDMLETTITATMEPTTTMAVMTEWLQMEQEATDQEDKLVFHQKHSAVSLLINPIPDVTLLEQILILQTSPCRLIMTI